MASIEQQLKKIIASKAKMKDGLTLEQRLKIEVDRLYNCIQKYIDEYYDSYKPSPTGYDRTWRFQGSMYAQNFLDARIKGNRIELSILFNDDLAYHPSLFGGEEGYVPLLINDGWHSKKLAAAIGHEVYRLTYYEGYHFIEKGIAEFNQTNTLGIHIDVYKS
ncbi:MAG: hypothetical protein II304_07675 [Bacteroidales bacterium]|nr:hypothetical protein [Bacteroidales bacterium]